jgi:hypothetical protein
MEQKRLFDWNLRPGRNYLTAGSGTQSASYEHNYEKHEKHDMGTYLGLAWGYGVSFFRFWGGEEREERTKR